MTSPLPEVLNFYQLAPIKESEVEYYVLGEGHIFIVLIYQSYVMSISCRVCVRVSFCLEGAKIWQQFSVDGKKPFSNEVICAQYACFSNLKTETF